MQKVSLVGKKINPKWLLEYEHRRIISQNGLTRE